MTYTRNAGAVLLLAFSAGSFAAKPVSIVFQANGETADGKPLAQYAVKCSNGQKVPLTAWDNRRKWCVGNESADNCHRKQIKAAKAACKGARQHTGSP